VTLRYEITAPAERDLEEIFFEVKESHGRLVAERVYDNLLRTFDLLARLERIRVSPMTGATCAARSNERWIVSDSCRS